MNRRGISNSLALIVVVSSAVLLSACLSGVQCPPPGGSSAAQHRRPLIGTKEAAATVTCSSGSGSGGNGTCSSTLTPNNVVFTLDGSGNILEYAINSDGSLSLMCNTAATASDGFLAVSNNSSFLYVFDATGSQIFGYIIGHSNTGTLTPMNGQPFKITTPGNEALIAGKSLVETDPLGRFLFVTDFSNSLIYVLSITAGSGVLSPVQNSPFGAAAGVASPLTMALDATGTFAFVADPSDGQVLTFTVSNTGQLAQASGSPFVVSSGAQDNPNFVVVHPSNQFIYTANQTSISGYTFDVTTGELFLIQGTPVSTASNFISPGLPAIDSTGAYIYAGDISGTSNSITGYAITAGTGALSPSPVPNAPQATFSNAAIFTLGLLTNPSAANLYVIEVPTGTTSGVVDDYPIAIASGQLTPPAAQSTLVANNNMVTANIQ